MRRIVLLFLIGTSLWGDYISVVGGGGQLGNQMFDIAATLAYGWDHQLKPIFPDMLYKTDNNLAYNRQKIFFRLDCSESPVPLTAYKVNDSSFEGLPDGLNDVQLDGGFFSWRYFDHHRQQIQDLFAPSNEVQARLNAKYGDLLARQDTVAVHVRTYSKDVHDKGLHFVGIPFFREAMDRFPPDTLFVIFSDRILWTEATFQREFSDKYFVFISGNDYVDDFFLMAQMKHQILSKSSFSWWAAYLNPDPHKQVIAPTHSKWPLPPWIKQPLMRMVKYVYSVMGKPLWLDQDYYLPDWITLQYSLEPYPTDLYAYGGETTSVCPIDK